jgi:hypothetical protein
MTIRQSVIIFVFLLFVSNKTKGQDTLSVSQKIVSFCDKHIGKKVGKGECWDLAKEALDFSGAKWTSPYEFGKIVSPKKDAVLPGDIIQFENVKIVYPDKSWKELPHHTAIIYKVISPGHFTIAEQNSNNKRFVVLSEIDLSYVKKGKYTIYHPE